MPLIQIRSDQVTSASLYPITSSWSLNAITASFANTASYLVPGNNYNVNFITSSGVLINGNLTVTGSIYASTYSASNIYVTTSQFIVTDNIITLNALTPYRRYAGLEMYDSGSGTLSSFLWDGQTDYFFLSGSNVNGKVIVGPDGQTDLTTNYVPKATAGYKLGNSLIYDNGTNVGIGTTSPVYLLTVGSTSTTTSSMSLQGEYQSSIFNNTNIFGFTHGGFDRWRLVTIQNSAASHDFDFRINSLNAAANNYNTFVTIKGLTGNVGIGTTNPTVKLHVSGSSYFQGYANVYVNQINTIGTSGDPGNLQVNSINIHPNSTTETMYIRRLNSGNFQLQTVLASANSGQLHLQPYGGSVGIGTSSPAYLLDVNGSSRHGYQLSDNHYFTGSVNISGSLNLTGSQNMNGPLYMNNYNIEGINTLIINDPGSGEGILWTQGYGWGIYECPNDFSNTGGNLQFVSGSGTVNVRRLTLNTDGNAVFPTGSVGIGTDVPTGSLHVRNNVTNIPILNLGGGEAANNVSDLYVLNSYNTASGVGYAAKVIGVNISGSLTAGNIPIQRTVWGGVTSATALVLSTDDPASGEQDNAFQIWTSNDGTAGTALTQKFSLTADGNVGIGTTSPATRLHVYGNGAGFEFGVGTPNCYIETIDRANVGKNLNTGYYTRGTGSFTWNNGSYTERMRIDGNGYVGIGTSSPSTYSSQVAIETSLTRGMMVFNTALADAGTLYGLGFGYAMSNYNSAYISFYKVGNSNTLNRLGFSLWNQNDILNILGNGNVGIGSTNPYYKFEVYSGGKLSTFTGLSINNFNNYDGTSASLVKSQLRFAILESPTDTYNSPSRTFTILESGNEVNNSSSDGFFAISTRTNGSVTEKLRVTSLGYVGIGTTAPTTKLHVTGSHVSGNGMSRFESSDYAIISLKAPSNGDGSDGYWGFRAQDTANNDLMFYGYRYKPTFSGFWVDPSFAGIISKGFFVRNSDGSVGVGTNIPNAKLNVNSSGSLASGSVVFRVEGTQGSLFSVDDSLSGSLMSVNDISGLPILEVFSDDRVVMGTFNANTLVVTGSRVGIGTNSPAYKLDVYDSSNIDVGRVYNNNQAINFIIGSINNTQYTDLTLFTSNGNAQIFKNRSNTGWGGTDALNIYTSNGAIAIHPATYQNAVYFATNGNVGIGTTNPVVKLDVSGSSRHGYQSSDTHQFTGSVSINGSLSTNANISSSGTGFFSYVGIGTTTVPTKLTIVGNDNKDTGPIISLSGESINQFESGRIRFTEANLSGSPYYQGAYVHYDGSTNTFNLGVHGNVDSLTASDTNAISILRSNAYVGIGTTNPQFLLDVVNTSISSVLRIGNAGGNNGAQLILAGSNTTKNWVIANQQNLSGTLEFTQTTATGSSTISGTPAMVINSSNYVGIGTTSPIYGLHVIGANAVSAGIVSNRFIGVRKSDNTLPGYLGLTGGDNGDNAGILGYNASGTQTFQINATNYTYFNGNNVGIGTSSPSVLLHVSGSSADGTAQFRIDGVNAPNTFNWASVFINAALSSSRNYISLIGQGLSTRNSGYIGFNHSGVAGSTSNFLTFGLYGVDNILNINGNGYVGIGTTNPNSKLVINGFGANNTLRFKDGAYQGDVGYIDNTGILTVQNWGVIRFLTGDPTRIERMRITSDGNVGIGTDNPGSKLEIQFPTNPATDNGAGNNVLRVWTSASFAADVGGAIGLGGTYNTSSYQSFGQIAGRKTNSTVNNNAGYLQFATTNNSGTMTEWMRIDSAGNVGIGSTNPIYKLDVNGTIRSTGLISNSQVSLTSGTLVSYVTPGLYLTGSSAGNAIGIISNTTFANQGAIANIGLHQSSSNANDLTAKVHLTVGGWYQNSGTGIPVYIGNGYTTESSPTLAVVPADASGNGNVGIGTVNPGQKLHVVGNVYGTTYGQFGTAVASGTNANNAVFGSNSATVGVKLVLDSDVNRNDICVTTSSGFVGIGTSIAPARLTVNGNISGSVLNVSAISSSGNLIVNGTVTCTSLIETSTINVKSNIVPLESQLDKVTKLNPVSFTYKYNNEPSIGLIAEEVAEIYPEFTSKNHDAVAYSKIVSVLIQSVKELKETIDKQQEQINQLLNK